MQPLNLIYKRGNFVYPYWGCTSIYWPLPYTFRSHNVSTAISIFLIILFNHSCFLSLKKNITTKLRIIWLLLSLFSGQFSCSFHIMFISAKTVQSLSFILRCFWPTENFKTSLLDVKSVFRVIRESTQKVFKSKTLNKKPGI